MTRIRVASYLALAVLALAARPAQAQNTPPPPALPAAERIYLAFDFGAEVGAQTLSSSGSSSLYGETATFTQDVDINNAAMMNLEGGARVWRNLYTSLAFTWRLKSTSGATVNGQVPHPLYINTPRTVAMSVTPLENYESSVHISAGWDVAVTDKIHLRPFGGVSIYGVKQDMVSGLTVQEIGPPYTAVNASATTARYSSFGAVGYNVGLDANYMFTQRVGARILVRFSGATVNLTAADGTTVPVDAGGFDGGLGIRFRF